MAVTLRSVEDAPAKCVSRCKAACPLGKTAIVGAENCAKSTCEAVHVDSLLVGLVFHELRFQCVCETPGSSGMHIGSPE